MIETAMILALGFASATLIAILIYPAVTRRAERLARRRVEALFPLSIGELNAEKDHLRAEFAVNQRRIERKAEEALASKHQDMEELGRRAVRIEALETDLGLRDRRIVELERELADTQGRLASTEADLASTRTALSQTRDTLGAVETAHRAILGELGTTRGELDQTATRLAETRTQLDTARERLTRRDGEYGELLRLQSETLGDLDARRIMVSDLETRLATQTSRANELDRTLTDLRAEFATERQRLADLAKGLAAEQERSLSLEQHLRAVEAERDARATEAARAAADLADLRAARDALQASLAERMAALQAAENSLGGVAPAEGEAVRAENAALRQRIDEVADAILARADEAGEAEPPAQRGAKRPASA